MFFPLSGTPDFPSCCVFMTTESGSCVLVIDGQRYVGFQYVAEVKEGWVQGYGFISGPARVLKRARLMTPVRMEFAGGSPQHVSILVVHDSGLALITFDSTPHPFSEPSG
jgi:hypothetical protein